MTKPCVQVKNNVVPRDRDFLVWCSWNIIILDEWTKIGAEPIFSLITITQLLSCCKWNQAVGGHSNNTRHFFVSLGPLPHILWKMTAFYDLQTLIFTG